MHAVEMGGGGGSLEGPVAAPVYSGDDGSVLTYGWGHEVGNLACNIGQTVALTCSHADKGAEEVNCVQVCCCYLLPTMHTFPRCASIRTFKDLHRDQYFDQSSDDNLTKRAAGLN